ncbi:MAG: hypothetical protein FWC00_01915 [Firmicutes bacterium]|nr:hypothetical protein [Bacillota bacterium]
MDKLHYLNLRNKIDLLLYMGIDFTVFGSFAQPTLGPEYRMPKDADILVEDTEWLFNEHPGLDTKNMDVIMLSIAEEEFDFVSKPETVVLPPTFGLDVKPLTIKVDTGTSVMLSRAFNRLACSTFVWDVHDTKLKIDKHSHAFKLMFDVHAYSLAKGVDIQTVKQHFKKYSYYINKKSIEPITKRIEDGLIHRAWKEFAPQMLPDTSTATPEKAIETFKNLATEFEVL